MRIQGEKGYHTYYIYYIAFESQSNNVINLSNVNMQTYDTLINLQVIQMSINSICKWILTSEGILEKIKSECILSTKEITLNAIGFFYILFVFLKISG